MKRAVRRGRARLCGVLPTIAFALAGCGGSQAPARLHVWPGSAATHPGHGPGHLSIATDSAALPLNLLIAQQDGRLVSVSPRGQVVWRERQSDPGAVFVSRTGRTEIVTEPRESLVVMRRIDSGAVAYVYGRRGLPGSGRDHLRDPQTALETASGEVVVADRGNCRVLLIRPSSHRAFAELGTPGDCAHDPPHKFAEPGAAFPAADGELVVTEERPASVDVLSASGQLLAGLRRPTLAAPSEANAYSAADLIVSDRTKPGHVLELDWRTGKVLWSFGPRSGPGELDQPTLARVLPDGNVLVVDSGNDRVIVIDRASKTIVWQYGHSGVAASRPGYLDRPTTATLVPLGGI